MGIFCFVKKGTRTVGYRLSRQNIDNVLPTRRDNVIDKIKGLYETDKDLLKKYALVLYEQARLLEGLSIEDVGGFVSAMSDIM